MLSVICIWIYMLLITFILGLGINRLAGKIIGYAPGGMLSFLLTGTAISTVYSEVYSLGGGVGKNANILLCIICIVIVSFNSRYISDYLRNFKNEIKGSLVTAAIAAFIFLLMAYGTGHGLIHYDTGLYHAQAIHWIEEYGIVKGLGNLHTRLAYNSAAFPFTALFSFAWLGGQSYHVTAGWCALLLAWECMGLRRIGSEKRLTAAAFARIMAIYYLLIIFDEMVSPASDYYMVCLAFILVIRWLDRQEMDDSDTAGYAMLALFAGYIITVKLSGAFLILFALLPGYRFIKNREYKKFGVCIGAGAAEIAPYLIRNVILSGYLLYPSTALNIFNVDWKIPFDIALSDYKEIQVYGRGMTDVASYEMPISEWFPAWFGSQASLDKLFILAAIVGVLYFVVKCLYYGFVLCRKKDQKSMPSYLYTEGILCICFIFWLFTSPLMRYGCLYVYLTAGVIWGRCLIMLIKNKRMQLAVYALLALFGLYKVYAFAKEAVREYRPDTFIHQQDYDSYNVESYRIDGVILYYPTEGDRTGYDAFPSSPWEMEDIKLRGEGLGDGFKAKE